MSPPKVDTFSGNQLDIIYPPFSYFIASMFIIRKDVVVKAFRCAIFWCLVKRHRHEQHCKINERCEKQVSGTLCRPAARDDKAAPKERNSQNESRHEIKRSCKAS